MTISQPIPILSTYLCSRQYDSIRSQTVSFQEGMDDGPQDETLSAQIVITERFCLCPFACKYYSIYWSCIRPCLFRLFFPSLFKFPEKKRIHQKIFHSLDRNLCKRNLDDEEIFLRLIRQIPASEWNISLHMILFFFSDFVHLMTHAH